MDEHSEDDGGEDATPRLCPVVPRVLPSALREPSTHRPDPSATVRRVTFNPKVDLRQYQVSDESGMSSNYGSRKARAQRKATPIISEDTSDRA